MFYSREQIQQQFPAVYNTEPAPDRSARYQVYRTGDVVDMLLERGMFVTDVSQRRAFGSDPRHARHMVKIAPTGEVADQAIALMGVRPEILITNSYDGTSRYSMYAGFYRLVCSNGLVIGSAVCPPISVYHSARAADVMAAVDALIAQFVPALGVINTMAQHPINADDAGYLAAVGFGLRFADQDTSMNPNDLLAARRDEDAEWTLWNVLNRVQEAVISGGAPYVSGRGRRLRARPVREITRNLAMNRVLWDEATRLLAR